MSEPYDPVHAPKLDRAARTTGAHSKERTPPMTNDAPERIWAGPNGEYWSTEDIGNGDIQYVRADVAQAEKDAILALIADADKGDR